MSAALVAWALAGAGCSAPPRTQSPVVPTQDPAVAVFRSDQERAWRQFRLGGGLNVVVVDTRLPAELSWRYDTHGDYSSSPSVAGETILFANNDHKLYAMDAATGHLLWVASADSQLMSQPIYAGGSVFVGAGNSDAAIWAPPFYKLIGDKQNDLLAFDLATGKQLWRMQLPGSGMPTPALVGQTLVHANGAGLVYAVAPKDGAYRWRSYLGSDADMSQVLDGGDGRLYAAGGYPNAVFALDARNGALLWRYFFGTYDGALSDCPLASDNNALYGMYVRQLAPMQTPYVPFGRPAEQHVYSLDKRTGALRWDRLLPRVSGIIPAYNESAIPLLYAGTLYDGSAIAPVVSALDPRTGAVKWQVHVNGAVKGGIAARDGVLYFGDLAGYLWAVDARTGLIVGNVKTDTTFNVGSPIVLNDSLVIGSHTGATIAIPLRAIRHSQTVAGVTSQ
ncbi:MAG: PQQ-binding-like beta-propeller repeat protein [Candidatus Eremiobacteraeota bacterium]|nr:PQQ-binding-like beta-propeller repeat protein [Candidatus Eremiobacteraeota bacterium]